MPKKTWFKGGKCWPMFQFQFLGLEDFINNLAGHPLVQNEKALHLFLQEKELNKSDYVPGKIRR